MNINETVRLPYEIIKGSIKKRNKLVKSLDDAVFNEIIQKKQITKDLLGDILQKNLGDNKLIAIGENHNKDFHGSLSIIYGASKIQGYILNLPLKEGKLPNNKYHHLMHEITHLYMYLTNPKWLARIISCEGIKNPNKETFYHKFLYSVSKLDKKSVSDNFNKTFNELNNQEKLNLLQDYRYRLINEQSAYEMEHTYYKQLKRKGIQEIEQPPNRFLCNSIFDFNNKIKYLEKEIKNLIKQMRNN